MFKKLVMTVMAMSLSASLYAGFNFDNPKGNDFKAELSNLEVNAPVPAAATLDNKPVKEWTIMVFVNGKNNLERFAMLDLNEMEMIGSTDKVNIVAELGRIKGYDTSDGDWVSARRYLVQKDSDFTKITSPIVADLGKVDMGDYKHLIEFGNWAKAAYPAKNYMMIVWNHGSGWDKARIITEKGISYDDETRNHISTPQLGLALQGMGGVNVYGSDACLMQMPEVDYEIKNYVQYIVGSEETEPGDGYTYNLLLEPLVANPTMTPEELGKLAVDAYSNHYQSIGQGSTQSLVKSAAMDGLVPLINDFVTAAMGTGEKALVKSAANSAQSFAVYDNKDMWHFLNLYAASSASAAVKEKAKNVQDFLVGSLVAHNRVNGSYADGNTKGLAVYLPSYSMNTSYNNLAWAKAAQWDEFITWYLAKDEVVAMAE